jgi:hypothetical protein
MGLAEGWLVLEWSRQRHRPGSLTWAFRIELSESVRAWTPVTRQTFDGVIAGVGNGTVVNF